MERLGEAGIPAEAQQRFAIFLTHMAGMLPGSAIVMPLGKMVGPAWSERSNGDLFIGIARGGNLTTTFLRRSTQTNTCESLRVSRIINVPPHTVQRLLKGGK